MKISVNDQELFSLSETQKKVLCDNIMGDELEADLKRRLEWVLMHKYEQCFKALQQEWMPKLKEKGVKSIPLDESEFAELVFAQPEYKCRKTREEQNA